MTEPIAAYYQTPWEYQLLAIFCVLLAALAYTTIRAKMYLEKIGVAGYALMMLGLLLFLGVVPFIVHTRIARLSPWLGVYQDHLTCGSWVRNGRYVRAPWRVFTNIVPVKTGIFEAKLRFYFTPEFAVMMQDDGFLRNQGWVYCQMDSLTDATHRYGLPIDTDEIFTTVSEAWARGRTNPRPADIGSPPASK